MKKLEEILNIDENTFFKKAFLFSLFFHILAIIFSEGWHRPDEHLGIFRLMSFKLGEFPVHELSWEHGAQIRPWLQPYAFYLVAKTFRFIGIESPFILATFLRLICSTLALYSLFHFTKYATSFVKEKINKNILVFFMMTMWYLPFFHARTTAENLSITFFIFGLLQLRDFTKFESKQSILSGFFFGLSYILRFQTGVMVFFALVWPLVTKKIKISKFILSCVFIAITIALSSGIDYIGYGEWTFTSWNYLKANIFDGVAAQFGVSPWYYYITKSIAKGIPPYSLIFIIPFFWAWFRRPKHYLTWITLPYFIIHSAIGHKELRFIFALGVFAPVFLAMFLEENNFSLFKSKAIKVLLSLALLVNFGGLIISSTKPAYTPINFYKHIYKNELGIKKLYTLSYIRDEMKFYQRKPFKQFYIKENKEAFISELKTINETRWVFTSSFKYILELLKNDRCQLEYASYPRFVLNEKYFKYLKRSKIWTLYKCGN